MDADRADQSESLIPGYSQVEEFGGDEEYEQVDGDIVEEVMYVTLDLGNTEPTLVPSSSTYRIIVSSKSSYSA
jgi:general transcription factor 3C polypeptide 6